MKFRVFWDVAPCSHVEVDRRFRGGNCLHYYGDETLNFEVICVFSLSVKAIIEIGHGDFLPRSVQFVFNNHTTVTMLNIYNIPLSNHKFIETTGVIIRDVFP
jgi:hypothetical protein